MKISVRNVKLHYESQWIAELTVGELVLFSPITLYTDDDLHSFHIGEPIFKDMLALNGLEGEFSKRFFSFIANGDPKLPWCFGEQDEETIMRVINHYAARKET